jgi:hypothetical protein
LACLTTSKHGKTLCTPQIIQKAHGRTDQVVFENYHDQDYGYLRVVANSTQLRVEYHPASDGAQAKTPDDFVTVDLKTRKLGHFSASDLGRQSELEELRKEAAVSRGQRHHEG